MRAVVPVLELSTAEADPASALGLSAPLSLRLLPGECAIIEGADMAQLEAFADLCSGLVRLRAGHVRFLGHDWAAVPDEYAAALRGRIGRVFATVAWLPFLDAETNLLLPQLHHSRGPRNELQAEATALACEFGLPGIPQGRLADLAPDDALRAILVRALLGEPMLLLLEGPASEFRTTLLNRIASVCDRGGAVIWLMRSRMARDARAFAATRWLRLTDHGLTAVRSTV
jgi:phospholipid/cholesterol/gamma-HCH transport system ATP-binding protein